MTILLDDRFKLARIYEIGLIDSAGDPIFVKSSEDIETTNKEEFMKLKQLSSTKTYLKQSKQFDLICHSDV